jgi:hypothetical protein
MSAYPDITKPHHVSHILVVEFKCSTQIILKPAIWYDPAEVPLSPHTPQSSKLSFYDSRHTKTLHVYLLFPIMITSPAYHNLPHSSIPTVPGALYKSHVPSQIVYFIPFTYIFSRNAFSSGTCNFCPSRTFLCNFYISSPYQVCFHCFYFLKPSQIRLI